MFCRVGEDLTGLECDIDKDIDQGGGDWLVRLNRVLFLNTGQEWLGVLVSPRAGQDKMAEFASPCQNVGVDPRRKGSRLIKLQSGQYFC